MNFIKLLSLFFRERNIFTYILCLCSLGNFTWGDESHVDEIELSELTQEPLYISLGSYCDPMHMLRYCELRKVAFPFDWIMSLNGEKLIEVLENDFLHFLNEEDLVAYDFGGALLHTRYELEFLHEGDWRGNQYFPNMQKLKPKYQRRIERFKQLKSYTGKVFFIRTSFLYSMTDPHRYFRSKENLEITDEYALRLFQTLKKKFPDLNFTLVIINSHNRSDFEEEKRLSDNLRIFRANPLLDLPVKIAAYKKFFLSLPFE